MDKRRCVSWASACVVLGGVMVATVGCQGEAESGNLITSEVIGYDEKTDSLANYWVVHETTAIRLATEGRHTGEVEVLGIEETPDGRLELHLRGPIFQIDLSHLEGAPEHRVVVEVDSAASLSYSVGMWMLDRPKDKPNARVAGGIRQPYYASRYELKDGEVEARPVAALLGTPLDPFSWTGADDVSAPLYNQVHDYFVDVSPMATWWGSGNKFHGTYAYEIEVSFK